MEGAGFALSIPRKRKKREFSKLIMLVIAIANFAVILFTCVMVWRTLDLSPLSDLIRTLAAEAATGIGFYFSKAKVENLVKLQYIYKDIPIIKDGVDINNTDESEGALG